MRKAVLGCLNDLYTDHELFSEETKKALTGVENYVKEITGKKEDEDFDALVAWLMYDLFMDAANMVLDFISGKKIEEVKGVKV